MNEIAPKNHYFNREYMRSERLLSYIDQLAVLSKFSIHSDTILEVGKGNGYFSHFIQTYFNQTVKTVDIVPELKPDYCVDISSKEFILPTTFDIGVCFEVMEHIEWDRLNTVVENLRKYVKKYLIISVPDANFFLQFKLNRLFLKYIRLNLTISIPRFIKNNATIVDSHFWEIGINHSQRMITGKILIDEVFGSENVLSHHRGRQFPGHHFFVLKGSAR
jgi:2-polyprenyl-3-methyl-5-hydroxy-6-metoxy-1,4-benzoquinol methylase